MEDSYGKGQMYPKECPRSNSFRYQCRYNLSIKSTPGEYWEGLGDDCYFLHLQLNNNPIDLASWLTNLDFAHHRNPQNSHSEMKSS